MHASGPHAADNRALTRRALTGASIGQSLPKSLKSVVSGHSDSSQGVPVGNVFRASRHMI